MNPERIELLGNAQLVHRGKVDAFALRTVAQGRDREELRATARLALTDWIGRALRDGAPYAPALASLRRFGAQGEGVTALEPFAATGAPKAADLAREFRSIADRLRAQVAERSRGLAAAPWTPASITIGLATYPADGSSLAELVTRADARLYDGKRAGGNRVVDGRG